MVRRVKVLVTGAAGFIGSHYVRALLSGDLPGGARASVTVLDALTYAGNRANLTPVADRDLTFVVGDICDPDIVDQMVAGQDAIVHFAAESHVDRAIRGPARFVNTNVLGTMNLLEAARRHGTPRFLHVSTDEVYGSIESGSWTEGWPLAPNSPYAASKASSDLLPLSYHRTYGLDVTVTRCSNNYGPYQFPEKLIPLFVTNLLDGKPVPLYGDGGNVRDWLHVADHCAGIQLALDKGRSGEIYHIGGGTELTNIELTERLLKACGASWDMVRQVTDRPGHDRRYSLSVDKARDELGYAPTVEFDQGLAETVAWYRENRSWWEPLKAPVTER